MPTILNINQGGTSETDVASVRNALGLGTAALYNVTSNPDQVGEYVPTINLVSTINTSVKNLSSYFIDNEDTKVLSIDHGGTGGADLESAKSKLGIKSLEDGIFPAPIPISSGGTGSKTSTDAIKALLPADNRNDGNVLQISNGNIIWNSVPTGNSNVKNITLTQGAVGSGTINFNGTSDVNVNVQYINPDYLNKVIPINKGGTGTDNIDTFKKTFGFKSGSSIDIVVDSTEPNASAYEDNTIWIQFTHEVASV